MQGLLQLPTNCIHEQLPITFGTYVCLCEDVWYLRMYVCMSVSEAASGTWRWKFRSTRNGWGATIILYTRQRLEWLEHWMEMCDLTYQRNSERGRSPRYPWRACNGELKRMPVGVCAALPPGYQSRVSAPGIGHRRCPLFLKCSTYVATFALWEYYSHDFVL